MAENASHTGVGVAVSIAVFKEWQGSAVTLVLAVAIINFFLHFLIDALPHGHYKNKLKELGVGFLFVGPFIIYAVNRQPLSSFAIIVILIGVFFGNVFDFLLLLAEGRERRKERKNRFFSDVSDFNLWIHWFVRKNTFLDKWGLIKKYETSQESWNGQPVYSLKFGWYNFIPIVIAIALLTL